MWKIKLFFLLIVLGTAGGGVLYVKNLQANLAISEANNEKLEDGVAEQKKLIEQTIRDGEAKALALKESQELLAKERRDVAFREKRFNKTNASGNVRDLGDLASNRPLSVERIINKDFNVMNARCFELAQDITLRTEEELAVKLKTDPGFNIMCVSDANPNYEGN